MHDLLNSFWFPLLIGALFTALMVYTQFKSLKNFWDGNKHLSRLTSSAKQDRGGGFIDLIRGRNLAPFSGIPSFTDPEDAPRPFAPHYEQHIKPHVNKYEILRIEALHKLRKRTIQVAIGFAIFLIICMIICMIMAIILPSDAKSKLMDFVSEIWGVFFLFPVMAGIYAYWPVHKYVEDVKGSIFPNIFSFFGSDYSYNAKGGVDLKSLKSFSILPSFNRSRQEDHVTGKYQDVDLDLCEAHLCKRTGSGKNQRTVTVFKGLLIVLSMNKNFSGKTVVKTDKGKFGNWASGKISGLEKVSLEDPQFERKFEVYSTDQIEARYLLSTAFMDRLLKLASLFNEARLQCSFNGDKLFIMIPSRHDYFEPASIFEPATFEKDINLILQEMDSIFKIIDILKLNQKTGI